MMSDWNLSLRCGDSLALLQAMPSASVNCCVTSPPYYSLRSYGTETWMGGDPACAHRLGNPVQDSCVLCGATRVDRQMGLESAHDCLGWATGTPCSQCYVCRMVEVFREVHRVLTDDGTCWLNLGDSYSRSVSKGGSDPNGKQDYQPGYGAARKQMARYSNTDSRSGSSDNFTRRARQPRHRHKGLPAKNLMGIPWRVAMALQSDGWILRQDIIWNKTSPLPESVKDRCTKSHEHIFLLVKSQRYYYDRFAIAEPLAASSVARLSQKNLPSQAGSSRIPGKTNGTMKAVATRKPLLFGGNKYAAAYASGDKTARTKSGSPWNPGAVKNKRDVWTLSNHGFKGSHFATFPPELPALCISAGCPDSGVVLDPFCGSGTTGLVALRANRRAILLDLNPDYIAMARKRIVSEAPLFVVECP